MGYTTSACVSCIHICICKVDYMMNIHHLGVRFVLDECGEILVLYVMFGTWMNALKVFGLRLDLFKHHVMAHFVGLNMLTCGCML
jgi:hypothetical protein